MRQATALALLAVMLAPLPAGCVVTDVSPQGARDVEPSRVRPTVVAVIDSGIDPYQQTREEHWAGFGR